MRVTTAPYCSPSATLLTVYSFHEQPVEEYRNQHQPTPLLVFLRHVKDTRLGAPSIGAYGEMCFLTKKICAQNRSATKFGPRIGGRMLEFF